MAAKFGKNSRITAAQKTCLYSASVREREEERMSGTASGWTPVGPAGGGRWELLVFCCIWLGLRARCAGIGTGKESGRMVFTDVDTDEIFISIR